MEPRNVSGNEIQHQRVISANKVENGTAAELSLAQSNKFNEKKIMKITL